MQQGIILPLVLLLGHRCLGRTERDCYGSEDKADSSLMQNGWKAKFICLYVSISIFLSIYKYKRYKSLPLIAYPLIAGQRHFQPETGRWKCCMRLVLHSRLKKIGVCVCMCVQENKQENPEKEKSFTPMLQHKKKNLEARLVPHATHLLPALSSTGS